MHIKLNMGQTLVELLISITLGLLLLGFSISIFQAIKLNTEFINQLIQIQETARILSAILSQDMHAPGTKILNPNDISSKIKLRFYKNNPPFVLEVLHQKIVYFISLSHRKNSQGQFIIEVNRKNLSESLHIQDAIAENISAWKIIYGSVENKHLSWVSEENVKNWKNVLLVKIDLTLNSNIQVKAIQKQISFIVGIK